MATLGKMHPNVFEDATLKGLRRRPRNRIPVATPSELRPNECALYSQGFKANPGLKLANAFSVMGRAKKDERESCDSLHILPREGFDR